MTFSISMSGIKHIAFNCFYNEGKLKLCFEISIPGEGFAVRRMIRTFIYLSKTWLSTLYPTTNMENNFYRYREATYNMQ